MDLLFIFGDFWILNFGDFWHWGEWGEFEVTYQTFELEQLLPSRSFLVFPLTLTLPGKGEFRKMIGPDKTYSGRPLYNKTGEILFFKGECLILYFVFIKKENFRKSVAPLQRVWLQCRWVRHWRHQEYLIIADDSQAHIPGVGRNGLHCRLESLKKL